MSGVSISPTQIDTDSVANVAYSYTGSGTLDIQINWYVGGSWVQGNVTSLAPTFFGLGNTIIVKFSVSDGTDNVSSTASKIVYAVPSVSNVIILPNPLFANTSATVFYNYTGSGSLDIQINWYDNGSWVDGNASTLPNSKYQSNDNVSVQVLASDGTDNATDLAWTIIGVVMPVVTNLIILPNQVDVDTTPAVLLQLHRTWNVGCSN